MTKDSPQELDNKIAEAQAPIDRLDNEHKQVQVELNGKIAEAQRMSQELNISVDKLNTLNKNVERYFCLPFGLARLLIISFCSYVRDKGAKALKSCADNWEQCKSEVEALTVKIEGVRERISEIDKEINESGASMANLRENIRIRKLIRDIAATQGEIDSHDMEEAAKARRNFDHQYKIKKAQEDELHSKVFSTVVFPYIVPYDFCQSSHIGGELSSHRSQLTTWEEDLREFKDINKMYTDQLIKVKVRNFWTHYPESVLYVSYARCPTWQMAIWRSTPKP